MSADDILRRRFIAIATDTFAADAVYPSLDVAAELDAVASWVMDAGLQDRQFTDRGYESLAQSPTYEQIRQLMTAGSELNSSDAVFLYVTGHGQTEDGAHWVVLHDSQPGRLSHKSLGTAELIRWIAGYRDLTQVVIIVDLCQAADAGDELPAALQRDLPEGWFVIFTAPAGRDAGLGAFSGVLNELITEYREGRGPGNNNFDPYLKASDVLDALKQRMFERHGQKLTVINQPYGTSVCLPNPRFDSAAVAPVATDPARQDLAVLQSALDTHWLHRAPVTSSAGSVFTGRKRLMNQLIEFATGEPGSLVVTGRAGCGKSAVLARLVTCSDAKFRDEYAETLAVAEPVPPIGSVDVAVLATGKTTDQVARQLGESLLVPAPPGNSLDDWIIAITRHLSNRAEIPTVVIDGLDEASDPTAVALALLQRLNPGNRLMRLLIGVRSSGSEADESSGDHELSDVVVSALGAARLRVDADEFWEHDDLASYAAQLLSRGGTPSAGQRNLADRIAAGAERSYFLTGLAARQLAEIPPGDVDDDRLLGVLGTSVSQLVLNDLEVSIPDERTRLTVWRLFRAAALSFGRGIPWRDIWPAAATAVDGTDAVDSDDVLHLLNHHASGYLIRDLEDGAVVYRLFHEKLREALAEGRAGSSDRATAQRNITRALLTAAGWDGTSRTTDVPPYIRRHLPSHAAAAGVLESILDAEKLPYLDPVRIADLLRLTQSASQSELWNLLGAWRSIRHRLTWEDPRGNAAALDAALLATGAIPPARPGPGPTWHARWSTWMIGGTVVETSLRSPQGFSTGARWPHAVFGSVADHVVLAVGLRNGTVVLSDASTGQLLGEPLRGPEDLGAVAMSGTTLAAISRSGELWIWDATTRVRRHVVQLGGGLFRSLAMARWHDRVIVAAAGGSGLLRVLWADDTGGSATAILAPEVVRSLTLVETSSGVLAALGHGNGEVTIWNLDNPREAFARLDVGSEVNGVDLVESDGSGVRVAVGTNSGRVTVWDVGPDAAEQMTPGWSYDNEIRAVAFGVVDGRLMLAAGDENGEVHLGGWTDEQADSVDLPHPDRITTVEFGTVDGRTMLATSCLDGNTRLWDPVQPSATRISSPRRAASVVLVPRAGTETPDVVTGNDQGVVQWWSGDGAHRLAEVHEPGVTATDKWSRGPTVGVAAGYVDDRLTVLTSYLGTVRLLQFASPDVPSQTVREFPGVDPRGRPTTLFVGAGRVLFATQNLQPKTVQVYDVLAGRRMRLRHRTLRAAPTEVMVHGLHHGLGNTWMSFTTEDKRLRLIEVGGRDLIGKPIRIDSQSAKVALGQIGDEAVIGVLTPGTLRLCDPTTGTDRIAPIQTSETVGSVTFARVGSRDVVVTGHHSTVRVWNPSTGRRLTQLAFGTPIDSVDVHTTTDGRLFVAVGGPGLLLTELRI
ncbi:AAA family ATPase [Kribbella sp. NPDC051620]|uniref:AAA family ATPase n=1 Tax=Kribbella sp. NPDC051620 TaxID=3364120 RepID=UPI0037B5DAA2